MARTRAKSRPEPHIEEASIAVAATDGRARVRITGALAGRPELVVRAGASVPELVARGTPHDLLVFHCDGVGSDELALFTRLKREFPELLIVAVCESTNGRSARRAVDAGVNGLIFEAQLEAALPPTVAAVLAGQTAVPRELGASVRKPSLSFRERQILGLVARGFTNSQIAARLFLAESTVKSHLCSAFDKLGVRSRNEAAALVLDPERSLGAEILAITENGRQTRLVAVERGDSGALE